MAMMTVYDPEGVAHTVEQVDGREYLKSGYYTREPPELLAEDLPAVSSAGDPTTGDPASLTDSKPRMKPGPKPKGEHLG